jgi:hypothetical protein
MENKKKNLWDLEKDSLHVKFWNWLWKIDTVSTYKTACPYYWQYAGAMVILPLILLVKLIKAMWRPIEAWSDARYERMAKEYVARLLQDFNHADTDEKRYKLYKSKCYGKYRNELGTAEKDSLYQGHQRFLRAIKKRKEVAQQKLDSFRYGAGGTILSYLIAIIVLMFIGWGIYEILHLFTMAEFGNFMLMLLGVFIFLGVGWGIIAGAQSLIKNFWCGSWIHKIVFWKYVGMFFVMIWTGIKMFFEMIHSIYTKSCPTINWK